MKKHLPMIAWIVVGFLLLGPLGAVVAGLGYWFYRDRKRSKSNANA